MDKEHLPFNYKFIISIILMGLGITLVTKSALGATAVTSFAFVLSLAFPLSFGVMTFLFNIAYIILQKIILKDEFSSMQYFQIVISVVLGLAIDFWNWVFQFVITSNYFLQIVILLIGSLFIALATVLQLANSQIYNPAEGIVSVIAKRYDFEFSRVKLVFDVCIVALAIIFSFIFFGELRGVREGTIITSLIIGPLIQLIQNLFN